MLPITEPEESFEINLVPMIDVIFSILAFFIISTLFLTKSQGLPVNLPSAQTAEPKLTEQINLTIEPDGDIFIDRQQVDLDKLPIAVNQARQNKSDSLVVINADEKVEHGIVVEVMDLLRQIPNVKMAIATKQK
ncbi:MAG: biopolymer transporter ExbD [Cyanobacteria bacterium J083]|nr:MAG: biopolymer transporter ExbD [Cyanobacteria bacterium J083]